MGLIREPGLVRGLGDRVTVPQDEPAGLGQAQSTEIFTYRAPVSLTKDSGQMNRVDADLTCHNVNTDRRMIAFVEKFPGAAQPDGVSKLLPPHPGLDQWLQQLQCCRLDIRVGVCPRIEAIGQKLEHSKARPNGIKETVAA